MESRLIRTSVLPSRQVTFCHFWKSTQNYVTEECGIPAFLFVYSLATFVFCKGVFAPLLCHFVCRGNTKIEPISWRGIAVFSLLRFHSRSSSFAGYCTLGSAFFCLIFPCLMLTRNISSRAQPRGFSLHSQAAVFVQHRSWVDATVGCWASPWDWYLTVLLPAPSKEGLWNLTLGSLILAEHVWEARPGTGHLHLCHWERCCRERRQQQYSSALASGWDPLALPAQGDRITLLREDSMGNPIPSNLMSLMSEIDGAIFPPLHSFLWLCPGFDFTSHNLKLALNQSGIQISPLYSVTYAVPANPVPLQV